MDKKTLIVDLDGVVFDFTGGFLKYLNTRHTEVYGIESSDKITRYNWWEMDKTNLTKEQWDEAFKEFTRYNMWQALELFPKAKNALCAIHSIPCNIIYITDRPSLATRPTLKSILKNGLPIDGIFFGAEKAGLATSLDADFAVDDKPEHIIAYDKEGIKPFLMDKMYNQGYSMGIEASMAITAGSVVRVRNLKQLYLQLIEEKLI